MSGELVFKAKVLSLVAAAALPLSELFDLYRYAVEIAPRKRS